MIAIGYDIGSSFVKAALVDAETGKPIERVRVPDAEIPMIANEIGWAEQDPKLWWEYLCDATKSLIEKANIKADQISSIGISCLLYTSPSPRDRSLSRMPSSA